MSLEKEVDLLKRIGLFANLEPSKLKLIAFTSEWLHFKPGQVLFRQGDVGDAAYIITQGIAEIIVNTPEGEISLANRGQNDIVGEIAIMCDVPRTATIRATTDLSTLKITKEVFFQLLRGSPEMALEIIRALAMRLEVTTQQLSDANARLQKSS